MTGRPALGLFGKLPWEGDFIQRGLSARFVRPWDDWLSRAMAASRDALGSEWSDAYLLSPPWSFVIEPGIVDDSGWAGVVLSSVDRVRRYFPLTLALELPARDAAVSRALALKPVCEALERTALSLIEAEQPLDEALMRLDVQVGRALAGLRTGRPLTLVWRGQEGEPAHARFAPEAHDAPLADRGPGRAVASGASRWWHDRWQSHAPAVIDCVGLPAPRAFAAFFDGDWSRHGWTATPEDAP